VRPERVPTLAELQHTLMRALYSPPDRVTHRATVRATRWIAPSAHVAPADALALYRRMGALRFEREVAREFPALRTHLGEARFSELARAFVAQRRSRSFTLDGYAETLPRFLARSRVLASAGERSAAIALASFELALRHAQGSVPGTDSRTPADPCLLDLAWDAPAAYAEWRRTGASARIPRRRTRVAVFAREGRGTWLALSAREAPLLANLLRGARLERAVACAVRAGLSAARIRAAFERWVANGLLRTERRLGPGTKPR